MDVLQDLISLFGLQFHTPIVGCRHILIIFG